jgi:uncharacterized membrane protein
MASSQATSGDVVYGDDSRKSNWIVPAAIVLAALILAAVLFNKRKN